MEELIEKEKQNKSDQQEQKGQVDKKLVQDKQENIKSENEEKLQIDKKKEKEFKKIQKEENQQLNEEKEIKIQKEVESKQNVVYENELENIILAKPLSDDRIYKFLRLPNQLTCLLISDKKCDLAAASVCVDVGNMKDPKNRCGLAHFCEHMLFMGSKKYPSEKDYEEFISSHTGSTNAYTDEKNKKHFKKALDMLAQFFISPLFDKSTIGREMKAVNSEHEDTVNDDGDRMWRILKRHAKKDHPYGQFQGGNLNTLKHPSIRDDVIKFHSQNYSANRMSLVVYSDQKIQEQESMIREQFINIKNINIPSPLKDMKTPFGKEELGKIIYIAPVKNEDYLMLYFYLDYQENNYHQNPLAYVDYLVDNQCKDSLDAFLQDHGLIEDFDAYVWSERFFSVLNIDLKLTKKGIKNYRKVLEYTFAYFKIIQETGVKKEIFEEIKYMNKLRFVYRDKQKVDALVNDLSGRMLEYPLEDLILSKYPPMKEYQPEILQKVVNDLNLDNCRIILRSQTLKEKCTMLEPIYKQQYFIENIPEDIREICKDPIIEISPGKLLLGLPPKNIFIPRDFDIFKFEKEEKVVTKYPEKILETAQTDVWYLFDTQFKLPKCLYYLNIYTKDENFQTDPKNNLLSDL